MSKEALKLALDYIIYRTDDPRKVIETIEEALNSPDGEAQPEQEPDDLTIAYMAGFSRGKDLAPQRTWVGLTWNDVPDEWVGKVAFMEGAKWADKQLKEKNNTP